ncbi:MAG: YcjF family protein, partial [Gemmataceae bacterium]
WMWKRVSDWFSPRVLDDEVEARVRSNMDKIPHPVFWLVGRTQSGKTSLVKFLTGAERAEIGKGYRPCTRYSSMYPFPNEQTPLMTFLDTRGLDEPGYDPEEDLKNFMEAHAVLVTVRLLDHAQESILDLLRRIREKNPKTPILLLLTCLHEAYPREQHAQPYPFTKEGTPRDKDIVLAGAFAESLKEQKRRFGDLVDRILPIDLTRPEEGFQDQQYGGEVLVEALLDLLPRAQAQTLRTFEAIQTDLKDLYMRKAVPTISTYSTMAATIGATPVPFLDLLVVPALQTKMLYDLSRLYEQPLNKDRLAELAGSLGFGLITRQAGRSLIKIIPGLGSVVGSAAGGLIAGASTFALGKAFCYYYSSYLEGHLPDEADLKRYYKEQYQRAEEGWKRLRESSPSERIE